MNFRPCVKKFGPFHIDKTNMEFLFDFLTPEEDFDKKSKRWVKFN